LELFESKYELLEKIGEGTNGVVRRCKKRSTGEYFAVKSFAVEDEQIPGLKSNFLNMKRLRHPNIIKYQALYIDAKKRMGWLVMELVNSPSLEGFKPSTEEELKSIMFQVLRALCYIHQKDMVHRDIKPDNILYDPQSGRVKIVDFGIAKRLTKKSVLVDMWTITGSIYYRAP
jgi:serine/threonine protein kinase